MGGRGGQHAPHGTTSTLNTRMGTKVESEEGHGSGMINIRLTKRGSELKMGGSSKTLEAKIHRMIGARHAV